MAARVNNYTREMLDSTLEEFEEAYADSSYRAKDQMLRELSNEVYAFTKNMAEIPFESVTGLFIASIMLTET
jgi:hypothetical protein